MVMFGRLNIFKMLSIPKLIQKFKATIVSQSFKNWWGGGRKQQVAQVYMETQRYKITSRSRTSKLKDYYDDEDEDEDDKYAKAKRKFF